jgi:RNA polymerase sigma-70 factor (ECF subfamily)
VLEALQPSPVVTLNRAVAVWKPRGALLKELRRPGEAREALNRAISLANSVAEAKLIRRELDGLASA